MRFNSPQLAFCTHYSWFGVVDGDQLGIGQTYLFYNRVPALLSERFLTLHVARSTGESSRATTKTLQPLAIEQSDDRGLRGTLTFCDTDILCYHAELDPGSDIRCVRAEFHLPATDPSYDRMVRFDADRRVLVIETLMPRSDHRDPDENHPLTICVRIPDAFFLEDSTAARISGDWKTITDGEVVLSFVATPKAMVGEQTFVVGVGEGPTAQDIVRRTAEVGTPDSGSSKASSEKWLEEALCDFTFGRVPERLKSHYAKSVYQILSNTKAPRGRIGRLACYPSRGTYCAHYLWDACFTTLGVVQFNMELAKGFLSVLCENQEPDGKIPHFVCATWNRPGESQPPLIVWSAWRIYKQCKDTDFIRDLYEPLCRMVDWWFDNRDSTGSGLAEWSHRLESGWDNSPRFEQGRIAAVDLNSYLNREMRLLGKMAVVLGREDEAATWKARTEEHARKMRALLFDREDVLFYDRLVEQDRLYKVLTPACFMPLWTGVDVPPQVAHEMVVRYLLNPKHFWGAQPFPVVAYSDRNHMPETWWRGPVWPNISWVMAEVLRLRKFPEQHEEAIRRLVNMMVRHDELNELYSADTGKPLGAEGLCWGDSIFMVMAKKIKE